jgi:hypothetical protein
MQIAMEIKAFRFYSDRHSYCMNYRISHLPLVSTIALHFAHCISSHLSQLLIAHFRAEEFI